MVASVRKFAPVISVVWLPRWYGCLGGVVVWYGTYMYYYDRQNRDDRDESSNDKNEAAKMRRQKMMRHEKESRRQIF